MKKENVKLRQMLRDAYTIAILATPTGPLSLHHMIAEDGEELMRSHARLELSKAD